MASGSASTAASSLVPPPPPPPPPPTAASTILRTPKILPPSERPSANRVNVVGVPATKPTQRPAFAGVYPETLQHAAASLRKTEYREPLLSRELDAALGRPDELADRRHWSDSAHDARLERHQAGTALHASPANSAQFVPIGVLHEHPNALNNYGASSPFNNYNNYSPTTTKSSSYQQPYQQGQQQYYQHQQHALPSNQQQQIQPSYQQVYPSSLKQQQQKVLQQPHQQQQQQEPIIREIPINFAGSVGSTAASFIQQQQQQQPPESAFTSIPVRQTTGGVHNYRTPPPLSESAGNLTSPFGRSLISDPFFTSIPLSIVSGSDVDNGSYSTTTTTRILPNNGRETTTITRRTVDGVPVDGHQLPIERIFGAEIPKVADFLEAKSSSYYTEETKSTTSSSAGNPLPSSVIGMAPKTGGTVGAGSSFTPYSTSTRGSTPSTTTIINDPQAYIRRFATTTPAQAPPSTPPPQQPPPHSSSASSSYLTAATSTENPLSGGTARNSAAVSTTNSRPYDFARELRDSGLTERQKYSNQFQSSVVRDQEPPPSINTVYEKVPSLSSSALKKTTTTSTSSTKTTTTRNFDSVDALIDDMAQMMRTGTGVKPGDFCTKCGQQIVGDTPGVTALGNAYHVTCFTCDECQKQLAGCSFYSVDGRNLCQVDYMNSLEKCDKCQTPITQKILRAMGKAFHPDCFACPSCAKSLDGIPFTVDKQGQAYCLNCYHERFSPRCAVCLKAIAPVGNETEVARVIAMDRSYHIDCYKCEDCGLKLSSKVEGQGCYPIESHLFCKQCNLKRLRSATAT